MDTALRELYAKLGFKVDATGFVEAEKRIDAITAKLQSLDDVARRVGRNVAKAGNSASKAGPASRTPNQRSQTSQTSRESRKVSQLRRELSDLERAHSDLKLVPEQASRAGVLQSQIALKRRQIGHARAEDLRTRGVVSDEDVRAADFEDRARRLQERKAGHVKARRIARMSRTGRYERPSAEEDVPAPTVGERARGLSHGANRFADSAQGVSDTLGGWLGYAINSMAQLDTAMSKVKSRAPEMTKEDLQSLRQTAIQAGSAAGFRATEAAGGEEALAASGLSAKAIQSALPTVLQFTRAGDYGSDVSQAADTLVNVKTQFGLADKDFADISDTLVAGANSTTASVKDFALALSYSGLNAKAAGIPLAEYTKITGVLAEAGIKGARGGTGLRQVMTSLASPSKKAKSALASIGITAEEAAKGVEKPSELLSLMFKKLENASAAKRLQVFSDVFNRAGSTSGLALADAFVQNFKAAGDAYGAIGQAIDERAGAAQRANDALADNLEARWKAVRVNMENTAGALAESLRPSLEASTSSVAELTANFAELAKHNPEIVNSGMQMALTLTAISGAAAIAARVLAGLTSTAGMTVTALYAAYRVADWSAHKLTGRNPDQKTGYEEEYFGESIFENAKYRERVRAVEAAREAGYAPTDDATNPFARQEVNGQREERDQFTTRMRALVTPAPRPQQPSGWEASPLQEEDDAVARVADVQRKKTSYDDVAAAYDQVARAKTPEQKQAAQEAVQRATTALRESILHPTAESTATPGQAPRSSSPPAPEPDAVTRLKTIDSREAARTAAEQAYQRVTAARTPEDMQAAQEDLRRATAAFSSSSTTQPIITPPTSAAPTAAATSVTPDSAAARTVPLSATGNVMRASDYAPQASPTTSQPSPQAAPPNVTTINNAGDTNNITLNATTANERDLVRKIESVVREQLADSEKRKQSRTQANLMGTY